MHWMLEYFWVALNSLALVPDIYYHQFLDYIRWFPFALRCRLEWLEGIIEDCYVPGHAHVLDEMHG